MSTLGPVRDRTARLSWTAAHDERMGDAEPALVVTCGGRRLLVITREHPARVISTHYLDWFTFCIDARGVYRNHVDTYLTALPLRCRRHDVRGHAVDISKLVAEWQRVDSRRKSPRVVDVNHVEQVRAALSSVTQLKTSAHGCNRAAM